MPPATLINRVVLNNYKSFAHCDVELAPLTFIVGANGSGKSNFLDALRFVSDSLRTSLEHAVRERGGIGAICRRSASYPAKVGIRLDLSLANGQRGFYALEIAAQSEFDYALHREECKLSPVRERGFPIEYRVENGQAQWSVPPHAPPAVTADRLFLVAASGLAEFRPLYDALSRMGFYNFIPEQMREVQAQDAGDFLERNGSNLASVLARLANRSPATKERIEQYLSGILEGLTAIATPHLGHQIALELQQSSADPEHPLRFLAKNMSDGTLRALGILAAVFQGRNGHGDTPQASFIGIEEPETALHPAAAELLRNALQEASEGTQIMVTSHSPDLLDDRSVEPEMILAVTSEAGESRIGPLDEVGRSILRDRLFTAGELLRLKQLLPAPVESQDHDLFAPSLRVT